MSTPNVNVTIGGPKVPSDFTYKTVILKSNIGFAAQIGDENTKYVIRWNYDLGGQSVQIPAGCILDFDGGVITNGTLIGNDTYLVGDKSTGDNITESVTLEGTWKHNAIVGVDSSLSASSTNPVENRVVTAALENKVDAEAGKGLSSCDYTQTEKTKLAGIAENATANLGTITGITMNGESVGTSGNVNLGNVATLDSHGKLLDAEIPEWVDDVIERASREAFPETGLADVIYIATDTNTMYRWDRDNSEYQPLGANISVDNQLSTSSTNPVQNKVITTALNNKVNAEQGKGLSTNDYTTDEKTKLQNIQEGAQANVTPDWNATSGQPGYIDHKPDLDAKSDKVDTMNDIVYSEQDEKLIKTVNDVTEDVLTKAQLLALLGINGSLSQMFEDLNDNLNTQLGNINGTLASLSSSISDHNERIKKLEDKTDPPVDPDTFDYEEKFESLITAFNALTSIDGAIGTSSDPTNIVRVYLKKYYDEACAQWEDTASVLFKESTYPEIYRSWNIDGVKGTNTGEDDAYYELAFDAMTAWLMAMCLTELKPSNNSTNAVSNNQTEFFLTAYNYGAPENPDTHLPDGRQVDLYDDYAIHCDPMIARLAAGAVYAKIRGGAQNANGASVTQQEVVNVRTALGGSRITTSDSRYPQWSDINCSDTDWYYLNNQYTSTKPSASDPDYRKKVLQMCGNVISKLGYAVNTNSIFPATPGPRVPKSFSDAGAGAPVSAQPYPSTQGQSAALFNGTTKNYLVDEAINAKVINAYNLQSEFPLSSWQAYDEATKNRIIQVVATSRCTGMYIFGAKKYVKSSSPAVVSMDWSSQPQPLTYWGYSTNRFNMYKFEASNSLSSDGLIIDGPFSMHSGLWHYIGEGSSSSRSVAETYIENSMKIADNMRYPLLGPQYGRSRPGSDPTQLMGHPGANASHTPGAKEDNLYNVDISAMVADNYTQKASWASENGIAADKANSYVSGHSAQIWYMAMMLTQMNPDRMEEYMQRAYMFSVNRSIGRQHWNSDLIYGRLFGTITLPIINAMTDFSNSNSGYYEVKRIVTRAPGPVQSGITIVLQNESGSTIIVQSRARFILNNGNDAQIKNQIYFNEDPYRDVTIPSGGSHTFTAVGFENNTPYYGYHFAPQNLWGSYNSNIVFFLGGNSSNPDYGRSDYYKMPAAGTGDYCGNGATYIITYRGNSAGSSGVPSDKVKLIFKNNTTSSITIRERLRLRLSGNTGINPGPWIVNNSSKNFTIPAGGQYPAVGGSDLLYSVSGLTDQLEKAFASQAELDTYSSQVGGGVNFTSNLGIYQVINGVGYENDGRTPAVINPVSVNSSEHFRGGATYTVNLGGSNPSTIDDAGAGSSITINYNGSNPDPYDQGYPEGQGTLPSVEGGNTTPTSSDYTGDGLVQGTITIVNESGASMTVLGSSDYSIESGWFIAYGNDPRPGTQYNYYRFAFKLSKINSGDSYTIPNMGRCTYNVKFYGNPDVGLGMNFADATSNTRTGGRYANNALYIGGHISWSCVRFATSAVFKNQAHYTIVFPNDSHNC